MLHQTLNVQLVGCEKQKDDIDMVQETPTMTYKAKEMSWLIKVQ